MALGVSGPQQTTENACDNLRSLLRILVVGDSRDGADSLAMMLKVMGNDTCTAYDGEHLLIPSLVANLVPARS